MGSPMIPRSLLIFCNCRQRPLITTTAPHRPAQRLRATSHLSPSHPLQAHTWAACSPMAQRCEARWRASSSSIGSRRLPGAAALQAPLRAAAAPAGGRRWPQPCRHWQGAHAAVDGSGPPAGAAQPQQQAQPLPSFMQPPPPPPPPPAFQQAPPPPPATPQFAQPPPGQTSHTAALCESSTAALSSSCTCAAQVAAAPSCPVALFVLVAEQPLLATPCCPAPLQTPAARSRSGPLALPLALETSMTWRRSWAAAPLASCT